MIKLFIFYVFLNEKMNKTEPYCEIFEHNMQIYSQLNQ